eukprot:TRINITY_DN7108_c0_g8_i1.p1 TRINITY_DN7108_c0_g8~~TRINITY_DN7108_c0_g8_i1.p1  ORF type:complete len:119 (-),score=9.93 TRINITY_DN7108_c0_g8_i1:36-392(-)
MHKLQMKLLRIEEDYFSFADGEDEYVNISSPECSDTKVHKKCAAFPEASLQTECTTLGESSHATQSGVLRAIGFLHTEEKAFHPFKSIQPVFNDSKESGGKKLRGELCESVNIYSPVN